MSSRTYEFGVQHLYKVSRWRIHFFICILASISGLFQFFYKSHALLNSALNALKVESFGMYAFSYVHHVYAKGFAYFLNQLITFELPRFGNFQVACCKAAKYRRIVPLSITRFIFWYLILVPCFGLSDAFWPNAPWKFVPFTISSTHSSCKNIGELYIQVHRCKNLSKLWYASGFRHLSGLILLSVSL